MYNTNISDSILSWYYEHKRILPWRETDDPYKIWLSEVMLQQTQVKTVIPYYNQWIDRLPNIECVALSNLSNLLKLWEGLGYYSRCRNFYKACKIVCNNYHGKIPDNISLFKLLPGVGEYISGAVMSIAYKLPYPAIDGNLTRIMIRYLGIKNYTKHNQLRVKKELSKFVDSLQPGDINQALMDIGSSICKPNITYCALCPLHKSCRGYLSGKPLYYSIKKNKKVLPLKNIIAGFIIENDKIFIVKRLEEGLLGGLWELPMITVNNINDKFIYQKFLKDKYHIDININKKVGNILHSFTHYKMSIDLYKCTLSSKNYNSKVVLDNKWIDISKINQYAFHKANHKLFDLLSINNV